MPKPFRTVSALAVFALAWVPITASADGDAMRGGELAKRWCATCHIIDAKGTGVAVDTAPPFTTVSRRDPASFRAWMTGSHPQMPKFDIGRREIDDLLAYIQSLPVAP